MNTRLAVVAVFLVACATQSPPLTAPPPPTPAPVTPQYARPAASATWTADMKVGRCAGIQQLAETKAAGYDYGEISVQAIVKLSEEDFEKTVVTHQEVGLPTPIANLFLPGDMKVTGPHIDVARQMEYVNRAFDRMARLGVKIIVFGSGTSRKVPDDWARERAFEQLVEFAKRIAPEAEKRGIVLAVEPLRKQETNIINSAAEGLKWVQAVNHPHFQLMVDFYHLATEEEDADILLSAKDHIVHLHFANPIGRVYPKDPAEYDYDKFFANVRKAGYRTGISMEANTRNFAEEGPVALSFLKAQLRLAGSATAAQ
jgi:D-psicose/D-tagatose/L-ribulose 3-epimerase